MKQRNDVFLRQRWCVRIGELARKAVKELGHTLRSKQLHGYAFHR